MKNIIILLTTLVGMVMTVDAHVAFKQVTNITNVTMSKLLRRGYSEKKPIISKTVLNACAECVQELETLIQQNKSTQDPQVAIDRLKKIESLYEELDNVWQQKNDKKQKSNCLDAKATLKLFEKK